MSAQLEDGYTRTANELLDHLMQTRLNGTQHSIIYCVIRNTYGFQRKSHTLSLTFIAAATKIHKDLIKRELDKLIEFKVLTVFKEAGFRTTREVGINKNTEEWHIYSEPKSRQSTKQSTVSESVGEQSTKQSTPTVDESVYQERKSFKDIKDNTTTENGMIKILNAYCEIHRKLDIHLKPKERSAMGHLSNSGIPIEFILSSMDTLYKKKIQDGEQVTSFMYYPDAISDAWKRKTTVVEFKQQKLSYPMAVGHAVPGLDETKNTLAEMEQMKEQKRLRLSGNQGEIV